MAIDRIGSGSAAQRASEQLAQARAAASRVATPGTGGANTIRATNGSADATSVIARAAARVESLHALTAKAEWVSGALDETTGLLDEMRAILREQAAGSKRGGLEETRARLADIAASIARAEAKASGEAPEASNALGDLRGPGSSVPGIRQGFVIADVNDGITKVTGKSSLPPGSVRDIDLEVLTSGHASQIGMYFNGPALDLKSPTSSFRIQVGGALGSRELSFASGTRLQDIVATINSFAGVTGVSAKVDAENYDITMLAPEQDGAFVSLRVLDDAGENGGLYDLNIAGRQRPFTDLDLTQEFREDSSVLTARINGVDATVAGRTIHANNGEWSLDITIDESLNTGGTYNLFTLFKTGGSQLKPQDVPPEFGASLDGGAIALGEARAAAAQVQPTDASSPRLDAARAAVGTRLAEIRALLQGSLGEARVRADATLASLLREGPKSGWRIDAKG